MIRINLLPIKHDRRREAGRSQLLIGVAVLGLEIIAFSLFHWRLGIEVEEQRNANRGVKDKVEHIQRQIKDHQTILDDIAEYEKRQEAIESLEAARSGPTYVLLELSNLVSLGGRPAIDHDRYQEMVQLDPASGYDENWDHRRLWIDSFQEKERIVRITGQALTHEDVAEFLRRINLSDFFVSSELVSTDLNPPSLDFEGFDKESADPVVHFVVNATVRYR